MDSPSFSSTGSPVSSIDASERRQSATATTFARKGDIDESAMQVDENTPLASTSDSHKKRKNEDDEENSNNKEIKEKEKPKNSSKILQSSRYDNSDDDDSEDEPVVVVASSSSSSTSKQQVKRPKLSATHKGKESASTTPARPSSTNATSSKNPAPSSSAVKDAQESSLVHFKNGKLLLKQKKIDFAQQSAALQKRIEWNEYIEEIEEPLEKIPKKFHALVALMVHESERTQNDLAKTVKNALNPPLTGDEDSQSDDAADKLPLEVVSKTIKLLAERVNHGFRDNPTAKESIVTIDDSDDDKDVDSSSESGGKKKEKSKQTDSADAAERDLPKGYETVPAGLRIWRWEVKPDLRKELFDCLPKEMQDKIEARAEERLQARDEAKKLLAAMSKSEQKEILLKGKVATEEGASNSKSKISEKGKEKADKPEKKSKGTSSSASSAKRKGKEKEKEKEEEEVTSTEKEKEKAKPAARKVKELTEEEKVKKEEERIEKEKKKAEKEAAKAEKEAAKAEKEAAKAEKEAAKAEKEAAKAEKLAAKAEREAAIEEAKKKKEQAQKQQKNAFGAWLAKAGTSPVEAIPHFAASSSSKPMSRSSSASDRGSAPPAAVLDLKSDKTYRDYRHAFRPFFVRAGVEVAPINRFAAGTSSVKKEENEEMQIAESVEITKEASLKDFMSRASLERIPSTSKLDVQPINSVMAALQEYEIQGDMESYHRLRAQLRNTDKYPLKLIKFHLDVRPGYFGTWTKKSSTVSGRNPFSRDIDLLDYEYDSEAEWDEDPEDAEDIKDDSGDEEMLSGDSEDDLDGWLAGDDEVEFEAGYDGEMLPLDDANDPFAMSQLLPGDEGKKKAKKTGKPAVRRKKNTGPLVTIIKGPYWEDEGDAEDEDDERGGLEKLMSGFRISWLNENESGTLDPFAFVEKKSKTAHTANIKLSNGTTNADGTPKSGDKSAKRTGPMQVKLAKLPEAVYDDFRRIVAAATCTTKARLVEDILADLQGKAPKISRSVIDRAVINFVDKKKKADIVQKADGSPECLWEINDRM